MNKEDFNLSFCIIADFQNLKGLFFYVIQVSVLNMVLPSSVFKIKRPTMRVYGMGYHSLCILRIRKTKE